MGKPGARGTSWESWCCFLSDLTRSETSDCAGPGPFAVLYRLLTSPAVCGIYRELVSNNNSVVFYKLRNLSGFTELVNETKVVRKTQNWNIVINKIS